MTEADKLTIRLSTRGRATLPKALRQQLGWKPGTRLLVVDTPAGVVLKKTGKARRRKPRATPR